MTRPVHMANQRTLAMTNGCAFCHMRFVMCFPVDCARCGKAGCSNTHETEEGDEWECAECNERENRRERAKLGAVK